MTRKYFRPYTDFIIRGGQEDSQLVLLTLKEFSHKEGQSQRGSIIERVRRKEAQS